MSPFCYDIVTGTYSINYNIIKVLKSINVLLKTYQLHVSIDKCSKDFQINNRNFLVHCVDAVSWNESKFNWKMRCLIHVFNRFFLIKQMEAKSGSSIIYIALS